MKSPQLVTGGQEGQDGQGLGEAALDGAEGQAEDVAEVTHDHVQGPPPGRRR